MLRGSYSAKIDEKGRLKIPNAFKAIVEERHGTTGLYVTSVTGDSVRIYPMPVWAAVEQRLARRVPVTSRAAKSAIASSTNGWRAWSLPTSP